MTVDSMDSSATRIACEEGRVFYAPGDTGEVLFLLETGRVQLYRLSPEGKKLIMATLGPGSLFGEISMNGEEVSDTFAEAVENCTLYVMGRSDLERMLVTHPQLRLRAVETLGQRLREVEARLEDITLKGIPARLASLLLRLQEKHGVGGTPPVIEGYTHEDLAGMIGTHRETATKALNDFKRAGLLDIGPKWLELYDLEGLQVLAEQ